MLATESKSFDKKPSYRKASLHSSFSRKIEKSIDEGNQKLVVRLKKASSTYSQKVMNKSLKSYQKRKYNLAT